MNNNTLLSGQRAPPYSKAHVSSFQHCNSTKKYIHHSLHCSFKSSAWRPFELVGFSGNFPPCLNGVLLIKSGMSGNIHFSPLAQATSKYRAAAIQDLVMNTVLLPKAFPKSLSSGP